MKKGFTLVELSIVLVIIGLLIGGVLVGQGLISSARVARQVKQIQSMDIVTNNFLSIYRSLPGESSDFNSATKAGIASQIRKNGALTGPGASEQGNYAGEHLHFFPDLSAAGMLKESYQYAVRPEAGPGQPFPYPAFFGENNRVIRYDSLMSNEAHVMALTVLGNFQGDVFWVIDALCTPNFGCQNPPFTAAANMATASPFFPSEAAAIDVKMDDGKALSGNVLPVSSPRLSSLGPSADPSIPVLVQDGGATDTVIACAKANGDYALDRADIYQHQGGVWTRNPICGLIIRASIAK